MIHCSCFAAEKYCTSCSCKNCCNHFDFVYRVFGKKLNIDSRDPFLFPSKFLEGMSEQPENGTHIMPASTGVVEGCKCQNLRCLDRHCPCWESNVTCSSGCQCKGCLNVHSQKREDEPDDKVSALEASKVFHQDWRPVYKAGSMKKLTHQSHLSLCRHQPIRVMGKRKLVNEVNMLLRDG